MADPARPPVTSASAPDDAADRELLARIRGGDAAALDALLDRYWSPLVSYAARLLGTWDPANDVAQEVFVRLWERREAWGREGSVRALLYRMTRNRALDERKRRERRAARMRSRRAAPLPSVVTPAERLQETELESAFARALAALPERRREVFLLARAEGLTHRQIAEVLGIAPQTVANQLSAALAALREGLEPFLEEPGRTASAAAPKASRAPS